MSYGFLIFGSKNLCWGLNESTEGEFSGLQGDSGLGGAVLQDDGPTVWSKTAGGFLHHVWEGEHISLGVSQR